MVTKIELHQAKSQAVEVKDWYSEEEWDEYPEGARDKSLRNCPSPSSYGFLKANHRYLFKLSFARYPEQYWVEIFCYRLGLKMGVAVPPAFVAFDSQKKQSGALIEWFFAVGSENFISGGDFCEKYIPNFDRKKGRQHNIETIAHIFTDLIKNNPKFKDNWEHYWAKTLAFDALVGNTDRHQDNWGVIKNPSTGAMRIAPAFDNGTSLGCEILADSFSKYDDIKRAEKYISSGCHHLKWSLSDSHSMGHLELLQKFAIAYPETRLVMLSCLKNVNDDIFNHILNELIAFDVPLRLNPDRAAFMLRLLRLRVRRLISGLEN